MILFNPNLILFKRNASLILNLKHETNELNWMRIEKRILSFDLIFHWSCFEIVHFSRFSLNFLNSLDSLDSMDLQKNPKILGKVLKSLNSNEFIRKISNLIFSKDDMDISMIYTLVYLIQQMYNVKSNQILLEILLNSLGKSNLQVYFQILISLNVFDLDYFLKHVISNGDLLVLNSSFNSNSLINSRENSREKNLKHFCLNLYSFDLSCSLQNTLYMLIHSSDTSDTFDKADTIDTIEMNKYKEILHLWMWKLFDFPNSLSNSDSSFIKDPIKIKEFLVSISNLNIPIQNQLVYYLKTKVKSFVTLKKEIGIENWKFIGIQGHSLLDMDLLSKSILFLVNLKGHYALIDLCIWLLEHTNDIFMIDLIILTLKWHHWIFSFSFGFKKDTRRILKQKLMDLKRVYSFKSELEEYLNSFISFPLHSLHRERFLLW